jgi:hypothetical protein
MIPMTARTQLFIILAGIFTVVGAPLMALYLLTSSSEEGPYEGSIYEARCYSGGALIYEADVVIDPKFYGPFAYQRDVFSFHPVDEEHDVYVGGDCVVTPKAPQAEAED